MYQFKRCKNVNGSKMTQKAVNWSVHFENEKNVICTSPLKIRKNIGHI